MSKKIFNYILVVGLTLVLGIFFSIGLTSLGLPKFLITGLTFFFGFFMPDVILKWLDKPTKEEAKSEE